MLGFLFGFNARLGRLHYFLSTIAPGCGDDRGLFRHCELCDPEHAQGNGSIRRPDCVAGDRLHPRVLVDHLHAAVHAYQGYRMGPCLRHPGVDRAPHRR